MAARKDEQYGPMAKLAHAASSNLVFIPGSNPGGATTGSIESELVCRAKRFDKSERRLAAGQTALICYRGGKPDTEVLKISAGDCVPVGIGSVAPGFLSF